MTGNWKKGRNVKHLRGRTGTCSYVRGISVGCILSQTAILVCGLVALPES